MRYIRCLSFFIVFSGSFRRLEEVKFDSRFSFIYFNFSLVKSTKLIECQTNFTFHGAKMSSTNCSSREYKIILVFVKHHHFDADILILKSIQEKSIVIWQMINI